MDLMEELREDMRSDNLNKLWEKYGRFVIYAAVSVVIITAGFSYEKHHRHTVAMEATGQYMDATRAMLSGDHASAVKILDGIDVSKSSEFYSLVLLKKAQALSLSGKKEEADKLNAELAGRSDAFGDVGKLLAQGDALADKSATPLAELRKEWQAWKLVDAGKTKEAAVLFAAIAGSDKITASQRERAEMMSTYLGEK